MIKKIRDYFNNLTPDKKRKTAILVVCGVLLLLIVIGYISRISNKPAPVKKEPVREKTIDLTKNDEDMALRLSFQNQINELSDKNEELMKGQEDRINELKQQIENMRNIINAHNNGGGSTEIQKFGEIDIKEVPESPENENKKQEIQVYSPTEKPQEKKLPIVVNGSIGSLSVPQDKGENKKDSKKKLVNFIPSGTIFKATLTNGMFAPTMSKGKSTPYPAHFRLWDLGFLPNGVREDLSGCFIMGEATGELADSRAHVRLSRLSCISNDQKRVLQKDIKGFVVGDDGKVGIFGEIRANFGKVALSALLAEFLSAAGDTVKTASQTITQNPLGGYTTTFPKTQDIAVAAAASGFGEAAKKIAEFYLDIMKEMTPVIEINGRRDVEIIVDVGLELLTDDFKWEGVKDDESFDISELVNLYK